MSLDVQHNTATWHRPDAGADAMVGASWLAVDNVNGSQALLLIECDGSPEEAKQEMAAAEAICRAHASVSFEGIERAASEAFRSAWSDPLHPAPAWVLREAVEAYADMIGDDITDDDVRELGFAGALSEYHGYSNAMREQQPWTVIYSAAQVAAMAEWHAAL